MIDATVSIVIAEVNFEFFKGMVVKREVSCVFVGSETSLEEVIRIMFIEKLAIRQSCIGLKGGIKLILIKRICFSSLYQI